MPKRISLRGSQLGEGVAMIRALLADAERQQCGLCNAPDAKPYPGEFGTAWVCDQCRESAT